jgi:hypothetical protein
MTTLSRFWPTPERVDQCIRTEAETVDDAVLLAVHTPGPLVIRAANGSAQEAATEIDLFNDLMRPATDGSAVVVAITGDSGVGKSHMVRWLHARLQRHQERHRLVIVLVPKTASLREVVERILEPLEGDQYAQLTAELSRIVETLKPDEAKQLLATSLAIELDRMYQQYMTTLRDGGRRDDRALRVRAEHARGLGSLLRDPAINDGWFYPLLARIVTLTLHGGSEADTGDLRRFTPQDLQVPDTLDVNQVTRAAAIYLRKMQSDDGAHLHGAAEMLQDALDPALRTVFRFSEALGQRSIEEVVDDVRRHLLAQDRELVLLIEDFAALAGIQQPLLNLIIAESDHQGRRVRAPLRTALAVTDGFLPSRQTILTRAKREWIIPNTAFSPDEIIERFIDLAGAYLNAARWGVEELNRQYAQSAGEDLLGWVLNFEEDMEAEESDRLKAFGTSSRGHSLFPLSRESIAAMARREVRQGAQLVFNPRAFINHVLRDVLLHRAEFLRGDFPPPGFKGAVMNTSVDIALNSQPLSVVMRGRLASALVYWGGNPSDLTSPLRVSKSLFDAFQLTWPFDLNVRALDLDAGPPRATLAGPPVREEPPALVAAEHSPKSPPVTPHDEAIEAWATGQPLVQKSANFIRQVIIQALNERLDGSLLRVHNLVVSVGHIWLPFAAVGNPSAQPRFVVGDEARPLAFKVRAGVLALCRAAANSRSWDYGHAEDDYAAAQMLLDDLESQAIEWFVQAARRRAQAALRTLHRQALLLQLTRRSEPEEPPLSDYFRPLDPPRTASESNDQSLEGSILSLIGDAADALSEVRGVLLDSVGCFQRTGAQLYALDRSRLQVAWNGRDDEDSATSLADQSPKADQISRSLATNRMRNLLSRYVNVLEKRLPTVQRILGQGPDAGLTTTIKELLAGAKREGTLAGGDYSAAEVDRSLIFLGSDAARSTIRHVNSFSTPDTSRSVEFQLAAFTQFDLTNLKKTSESLEYLELLVMKIQRAAESQLKASGAGDIADALASLRLSLTVFADEGDAT